MCEKKKKKKNREKVRVREIEKLVIISFKKDRKSYKHIFVERKR